MTEISAEAYVAALHGALRVAGEDKPVELRGVQSRGWLHEAIHKGQTISLGARLIPANDAGEWPAAIFLAEYLGVTRQVLLWMNDKGEWRAVERFSDTMPGTEIKPVPTIPAAV